MSAVGEVKGAVGSAIERDGAVPGGEEEGDRDVGGVAAAACAGSEVCGGGDGLGPAAETLLLGQHRDVLAFVLRLGELLAQAEHALAGGGLEGVEYLDKVDGGTIKTERAPTLVVPEASHDSKGFVDRIYRKAGACTSNGLGYAGNNSWKSIWCV